MTNKEGAAPAALDRSDARVHTRTNEDITLADHVLYPALVKLPDDYL